MAGTGKAHLRDQPDIILSVEDLEVTFPINKELNIQAVSGISFDIADGETLGLVGESGCGKTTTGRTILQLPRPNSGSVIYEGRDLAQLPVDEMRKLRVRLQMIFQDPISSLNPRRKIKDIIKEGVKIWGLEFSQQDLEEVIQNVGLEYKSIEGRRPHEFSGGQCQRICIARALALDPKILICDEPVSALDVSIQAQILNLLEDMKDRYGLTMIFISHDLAVVENISDRVGVMYLGKMCEIGETNSIYYEPAHPYTHALLTSIPQPDPDIAISDQTLKGDLPSPLNINIPSGCRFRTRCPRAQDICAEKEPVLEKVEGGKPEHFVACHFPLKTGEAPVTWISEQAVVSKNP